MDPALQAVLAEYERRSADEWKVMTSLPPADVAARIDEFLIFIGPDTGKLLHLIASAARSQVIVELGASYGYSTLWLADAARATGGKVHSLELSARKVEYARSQLRRVGLEPYVEFHVGDALETLRRLPGPFDFVLVDRNMIFPPNPTDQAAYRSAVRAKGDMESFLLPVGSGVELSKKRAA